MTATQAILLTALALFLSVYVAGSFNSTAAFIFIFTSIIFLVAWFFASRRSKQTSQLETIVATGWFWVRRGICAIGAIIFLFLFVVSFMIAPPDSGPGERFVVAASLLVFMVVCVWVGFFGQGNNKSDWRDDVKLHRENKKRYGWRW